MEQTPQQFAAELRDLIGVSYKITDTTSFSDVFSLTQQIVGILSFLISPIAQMEQEYRKKVVEFIDAGDSVAMAEAKAKATNAYTEWKKYDKLSELAHEQLLLLKKFTDKLSDEFAHS